MSLKRVSHSEEDMQIKEDERNAFFMDVARLEREIAKNLASIRKQEGLTQSNIADKTGLTQQMVSRLEKLGNSPTLESFLKYVVALDLKIKFEKIN
ncbi:helix-turn-helix transcriptional regulator [Clostridiaceae bacterium UIB06]|uniref:Helix-turn-helix transcriptional regulator n=1 Tax=Clostridium thailandense TaxID=2794346 RepID=A0A949TLT2_9CLOT|nr:helix-turn-helix transcriptional regulator [Clostridium thailandense]MBV7271647.1 helix-turn-helix transcriptional regulator [Clostridium thailandense]MCH5136382.1 helix-turn-helix transcriptional regulator [Clostridiaceae bacterium UIB06]